MRVEPPSDRAGEALLRERLPRLHAVPDWTSGDATYAGPGWLSQSCTPYAPDTMQTGVIWPCLQSPMVYRCPSDLGPFDPPTAHVMTSYIMNGAVCAFGAQCPSFKTCRFRTDSILFWESGGNWADGSDYPSQGIAARHANGCDVAIIDGHVDRVSNANFSGMLNQSPGPLWCSPATVDGH